MGRKYISPRLRFEVLKRDGFACIYCGARASEEVELVIDHIEPYAHGGSCDEGNYATACRHCNAGKSDRPVLPDPPAWWLLARDIHSVIRKSHEPTELETAAALRLGWLSQDNGPSLGIAPQILATIAMSEDLRIAHRAWEFKTAEDERDERLDIAVWMLLIGLRDGIGLTERADA